MRDGNYLLGNPTPAEESHYCTSPVMRLGAGHRGAATPPPECAIVGMCVCVREVGKFLGRTLCPCVD